MQSIWTKATRSLYYGVGTFGGMEALSLYVRAHPTTWFPGILPMAVSFSIVIAQWGREFKMVRSAIGVRNSNK
jgi:hypothetical protein